MEKMTISEALDERDFLAEKIKKDIDSLDVITVKREKDPRTKKGVDVEEYKKKGASLYQSICDNIARYKRIQVAIVMSNAITKITLRSGQEMTVAEAIARKKMINQGDDLESRLYSSLASQNNVAVREYDHFKIEYENDRKNLMNSLLESGKSDKLDENQINACETMISGNAPIIVDALESGDKCLADIVGDMYENLHNIVKEINSAIKISNATTVIEF